MERLRVYAVALCGILACALLAVFAAGGVGAQASTGIVRVAPSGSNTGGCGSEAQPCQTLQFAVEQLIQGSGASRVFKGEVRIAGGTYTEGNPAFENIIGLGLPGTLTIRGGYSTNNWNSSDPAANPTILDGQGTRRGILLTMPAGRSAECAVTIDGLTIVNGRANTGVDPYGGGILIDFCAAATISNVTIRDSKAIGSDNTGVNPATSPGAGGGIAIRGSTTTTAGLILRNVTLTNNQALGGNESGGARGGIGSGGGLYAIYSTVDASALNVTGSIAKGGNAPGRPGDTNGQLADGLGGGIALIHVPSFQFANVTSNGNTARGGDAGSKAGLGLGGGFFIELSTGSINGATINGNSVTGAAADLANGEGGAGLGGGIFLTDSDLIISAASLNANTTTGGNANAGGGHGGNAGGGGIYATIGVPANTNELTASNLIIAANASTAGSGTAAGAARGGAILYNETTFSLTHATLAANSLTGGGGADGPAFALFGGATNGTFSNSIVADHGGSSPIAVAGGLGTVGISNILNSNNGSPFISNSGGSPVTQNNIFTGNPQFVSPGSPNFNYHLSAGSDAIDTATGSGTVTDIDGQPRPVGSAADVGADEYQIAVSGFAGQTSITLNWQAPPGLTGVTYEVEYVGESGAGDAAEGPSPINRGTNTSATLTGLTQFKTYTVKIVARSGGNVVAESVALNLRTGQFYVYLPLVIRF